MINILSIFNGMGAPFLGDPLFQFSMDTWLQKGSILSLHAKIKILISNRASRELQPIHGQGVNFFPLCQITNMPIV